MQLYIAIFMQRGIIRAQLEGNSVEIAQGEHPAKGVGESRKRRPRGTQKELRGGSKINRYGFDAGRFLCYIYGVNTGQPCLKKYFENH